MKGGEILMIIAIVLIVVWMLRRSRGSEEAYGDPSNPYCSANCATCDNYVKIPGCNTCTVPSQCDFCAQAALNNCNTNWKDVCKNDRTWKLYKCNSTGG
jgi:hypothetical protein